MKEHDLFRKRSIKENWFKISIIIILLIISLGYLLNQFVIYEKKNNISIKNIAKDNDEINNNQNGTYQTLEDYVRQNPDVDVDKIEEALDQGFTDKEIIDYLQNYYADDIPKVGGMDYNMSLEKNKELENLYENLTNLPQHHTVCFPVKKYYCNIDKCKEIKPEVFNLLGGNRSHSTISRCDINPCDTYDITFDDNGDYKIIQPIETERGFVFKMSYNTIDKKYVEVVTLGIDTYISYGYCNYDFEIIKNYN